MDSTSNRPNTRGNGRRNCWSDRRADQSPVVYTRGDCRRDGRLVYTLIHVNVFNRATNWRSSRRPVACSVYTERSSPRRSPRRSLRPIAATIAATIAPCIHHVTDLTRSAAYTVADLLNGHQSSCQAVPA